MLRQTLLTVSRNEKIRDLSVSLPVTRQVVMRFVAGEQIPDAVSASAELAATGRLATIDRLGEDVLELADAERTRDDYLALLTALDANGLTSDAEVSVKLSAVGQALPGDGEKIAHENAHLICERAHRVGAWVTIDAEDHTTTDSTLSIVRELRTDFDWLGTVLQAYLKRTEADCREFAASGARIRLCKGAYDEPATVAHRGADEVTDSYLRCLRILMAGSGYPMVASHDPAVIAAVPGLAREYGRDADGFEYQMLYGIRDPEQRRLAAGGNHVRVYVPFGTEWYGYFVRRLAERPANLMFFLRALTERR